MDGEKIVRIQDAIGIESRFVICIAQFLDGAVIVTNVGNSLSFERSKYHFEPN
jgi:hypothetical protein